MPRHQNATGSPLAIASRSVTRSDQPSGSLKVESGLTLVGMPRPPGTVTYA